MLSKEEIEYKLVEYITSQKWKVSDRFHSLFNISLKDIPNDLDKDRIKHYNDIWQSAKLIQNNYNPDSAWKHVEQKLNNSQDITKRRSFSKKRLIVISTISAAAIALLLIFTFSYLKTGLLNTKVSYLEYHVPYGSRSKVTLPDNTLVWLNAGSTLKYPVNYNIKDRQVFLEGEAFFEVEKKPKKAFIVNTESAEVKVLGTSFNLKSYPEENVFETTVATGIVEVYNKFPSDSYPKKVILKAHEKVRLSKYVKLKNSFNHNAGLSNMKAAENNKKNASSNSDFIISQNINPNISSSWKDNEWIIESESLHELAVKMKRRFDVTVHFKDNHVQHLVFSGKLKDENINQMLEAISKTAPINYEIKNADVYLSERKPQ